MHRVPPLDSAHLGLHVHIYYHQDRSHAYGPCSIWPFTREDSSGPLGRR